jgi:hypothetical protein
VKLFLIRLLHTVIWLVMASAVVYVLYGGISGEITTLTWVAVGLVLLEGVVLLIFRGVCPLRFAAAVHTDDHRDGFDIFLPGWLARYTVEIFTPTYCCGLILVLIRLMFEI